MINQTAVVYQECYYMKTIRYLDYHTCCHLCVTSGSEFRGRSKFETKPTMSDPLH